MKVLLILPLLAMKLLSPSAGDYSQHYSLVNTSCISDGRTYLHLNATIINNRLTVISKDSRKRINKTNDNHRCGLEIIRDTNANNFKVKYGIFSNEDCTGHSGYNVICANPERRFVYYCRRALKCCDSESNFCLNNFGLKRIVMKGSASIISDAHEMCSQKNSTHCFTLKKMYAPINNQNISTTNVTTSNPIVNTATLKTDNSSNS